MKKISHTFIVVLALVAMLVSACGATAASASETSVGAGKPQASLVEFTGVIESINGNQWTINGQVVTVDPAVIKNGPFIIGDTVKVEADVQADGSIVITRVEDPAAVAVATDVPGTSVPLSTPQAGATSAPAGDLVIDDQGNEAFGTVDGFDATTIVIGGQSFTLANGAEFKDTIQAGNYVKVHFILNADGTMSISEIELWDPAAVGDDNSNSNINGNTNGNSNDDGNGNSNDDDSNDNDDDDDNSNSDGDDD